MRVFLLFCLFSFNLAWSQPVPPDARTLELINQGREEEQWLKAEQIRVVRPQAFPDLLVIGFLAGENDCLVGQVVVNNQAVVPSEACGIALRAQGWEQLQGPQKIELATKWLEQVQFAFGEQIQQVRPYGFSERLAHFHPPETLATLTGSVRITCWVSEPQGKSTARLFRRVLYWFGRDGRLLRSKIMDRVEIVES